MTNTTLDIDLTDDERWAIYADVIHRNKLRKNAQLPLIDVVGTCRREIAIIRKNNYRRIMQPYIRQALSELPRPYGLVNGIGTMCQAKKIAIERMMADYGCSAKDLPAGQTFNQSHNGMVDPPPSTQ